MEGMQHVCSLSETMSSAWETARTRSQRLPRDRHARDSKSHVDGCWVEVPMQHGEPAPGVRELGDLWGWHVP